MAYGGGGIHPGPGFSSCLDDVPFKLGPKFMPPAKVILPPGFDVAQSTRSSSALNAEYTFEVEEAVLKWSAERERQQDEHRRLEEDRLTAQNRESSSSDSSENEADFGLNQNDATNSDPVYENAPSVGDSLYENTGALKPRPAPRVKINFTSNPSYSSVTLPSPLIANISSNNILQPTQIATNENGSEKTETVTEVAKKFDMTMFEKVDDPFDNVELQTINVMQELASVLRETDKNKNNSPKTPSPGNARTDSTNVVIDIPEPKITATETPLAGTSDTVDQNEAEIPLYENVQSKSTVPKPLNGHVSNGQDLVFLPPIPARRNLVGSSSPLPPIGRQSVDSLILSSNQSQINTSDTNNMVSKSVSLTESNSNIYENAPPASRRSYSKPLKPPPPVPKPPRIFKYSRHELNESKPEDNSGNNVMTSSVQIQPSVSNPAEGFSVQYRNRHSTPDLHTHTQSGTEGVGLNFVSTHFGDGFVAPARPVPVPRRSHSPPSRPSSGQSWNRYSPLPDPAGQGIEQPTSVSMPAVPSRPAKPPSPYLSSEARASVDNLITMGFPKEAVIRAVSKIGNDEKEVVEYLCLVDQLKEKGYSSILAETALLLFHNNMQQASTYLELFTQLQELGFNGEKIQQALVETKNDREKTIDILTAS